MSKIIFILGGARSGKSALAVSRAQKYDDVAYLATGIACDGEMKDRIKRHRKDRPATWKTFEEAVNLDTVVVNNLKNFDVAIVDCVGGWVTNMMMAWEEKRTAAAVEEKILDKVSTLLKVSRRLKKLELIIVSNETGLGLVPHTKFGREFRDILGRVNQLIAKEADQVYFTISGIAQKIK